jgi:hypothetical protein
MTPTRQRSDALPAARIEVTAHPPERRRPAGSVVLPCGCCCCCCCCLHSLGGLIGGIAGTVKPVAPQPRPVDPDFPFPFRRDEFDAEGQLLSAGMLYWLLVCFGTGLVSVWAFVSEGARRPDDLFMGLLVALMFLPLVQLGASAVAAAAVALFYADRATALIRIGKITLWSFVGTLIGIGIMGAFCGVLVLMK